MAGINRDNDSYERWLRRHCDVVEDDLRAKRVRMRRSPFDFLRTTYFRWARTIESIGPELADAPRCPCVGDIHVENFGTWRDADGRCVWGVNDFDEAAAMPYAYDLVRLATSARLATPLRTAPAEAARAILAGYAAGLELPRPALLDEQEGWLRGLVAGSAQASDAFWQEMDACPAALPPAAVQRALLRALPDGAQVLRFASRSKGGGSLGRPRFLVIAHWQGGRVVREAKAQVPSAWHWAHPKTPARSRLLELAFGPYRSPDPAITLKAGFAVRRIAPDARKVELADVALQGLDAPLLKAMGADLGALHAASRRRPQIVQHLQGQDAAWLERSAQAAEQAIERDFRNLAPL